MRLRPGPPRKGARVVRTPGQLLWEFRAASSHIILENGPSPSLCCPPLPMDIGAAAPLFFCPRDKHQFANICLYSRVKANNATRHRSAWRVGPGRSDEERKDRAMPHLGKLPHAGPVARETRSPEEIREAEYRKEFRRPDTFRAYIGNDWIGRPYNDIKKTGAWRERPELHRPRVTFASPVPRP